MAHLGYLYINLSKQYAIVHCVVIIYAFSLKYGEALDVCEVYLITLMVISTQTQLIYLL